MNISFDSHIATGHFGAVWSGVLTQQGKEDQKVAIKLACEEYKSCILNANFFLRYLQEDAQASSWVVTRFTILKDCKNDLALVTEFVESSLARLLESKEKGLSLEQTGQITKQIAGALTFLDKMGVVYPNLHPESILLSGHKVKLGNFKQAYFKNTPDPKPILIRHCYIFPGVLLGNAFSSLDSIWALALITNYMFTKTLYESSAEEMLAYFPILLKAPYSENFVQTSTLQGEKIYQKSLKVEFPSLESLQEMIERISQEKGEDSKKTQELFDLLMQMLSYENRISAQEILFHPFLEEMPVDNYEPSSVETALDGVFSNYSHLGSGAFGSVFAVDLVKNGKNQGKYVIKESKLDELGQQDLEGAQSVLDEDRFLRFLEKDPRSSFYIVKRYGVFKENDRICLVLGRMKMDLFKYTQNKKGLPLELVRRYAEQLLNALDFLAEKGIIHLDLKSHNILVSPDENSVVIADFGSACFQENACHPTNTCQITPWYRGPEVVLKVPFTTACDIWSLAIVLIESFIAIGPFQANSSTHLVKLQEGRLGKYPSSLLDQASEPIKKSYEKTLLVESEFVAPLRVFIRFYAFGKLEDPRKVYSFISFVQRALEMNPEQRPPAKKLLKDPFICNKL